MRKFAPNFEIIMADLLKTEQQFKVCLLYTSDAADE